MEMKRSLAKYNGHIEDFDPSQWGRGRAIQFWDSRTMVEEEQLTGSVQLPLLRNISGFTEQLTEQHVNLFLVSGAHVVLSTLDTAGHFHLTNITELLPTLLHQTLGDHLVVVLGPGPRYRDLFKRSFLATTEIVGLAGHCY